MHHSIEYIEARTILKQSPIYINKLSIQERLDAIRHLAAVLYIGGKYPIEVI